MLDEVGVATAQVGERDDLTALAEHGHEGASVDVTQLPVEKAGFHDGAHGLVENISVTTVTWVVATAQIIQGADLLGDCAIALDAFERS
ncbi:hypothetical protein [Chondromyces apiculatus]|uniref:hypothetical protein n=1 Tax=Chondromyces apiculatus TaxID=51 RepID=UPI0012DE9F27|nr:hypothetical protein [Chondromyces apiculatus]